MSVYGERVEALVEGLDAMLEAMREDYRGWSGRSNARNPERARDEFGETVSDRSLSRSLMVLVSWHSLLPVSMIRSLFLVTF